MSELTHPGRARATILGGALGDAWTAAFAAGRGGQPALFAAAPRLSADSWLALATCEAIARDGGTAAVDTVAATFREWTAARRGIDGAPGDALLALAAGTPVAAAAAGSPADDPGPAVRMAPLVFVLDPGGDADRRQTRHIVRVTHHGDEAWAGALAAALALRRCLEIDEVPADLSAWVAAQLPESRVRDALIATGRGDIAAAWPSPPDRGEGRTARVLQGALGTAVRHRDGDLEGALDDASGAPGDASRIAILTGQLLAAAGCEVPSSLVSALPERDAMERVLEPFVRALSGASV
jgi:ADP-ribosylglycohydrolase